MTTPQIILSVFCSLWALLIIGVLAYDSIRYREYYEQSIEEDDEDY